MTKDAKERTGMKTKGPYSSGIMLGRYNYNIILSGAIYRHQTIPVLFKIKPLLPLLVISIATVLVYIPGIYCNVLQKCRKPSKSFNLLALKERTLWLGTEKEEETRPG